MRPGCGSGMSKPSGFPRKNARASKNGFKRLAIFDAMNCGYPIGLPVYEDCGEGGEDMSATSGKAGGLR